jgi:hypothetical protein
MNERDFPHIVECRSHQAAFDDMLAFHRERGIEPRRGRGWHNDEQCYVRYCFADPAHADAFRHQFGGASATKPGAGVVDRRRGLRRASSRSPTFSSASETLPDVHFRFCGCHRPNAVKPGVDAAGTSGRQARSAA